MLLVKLKTIFIRYKFTNVSIFQVRNAMDTAKDKAAEKAYTYTRTKRMKKGPTQQEQLTKFSQLLFQVFLCKDQRIHVRSVLTLRCIVYCTVLLYCAIYIHAGFSTQWFIVM